MIDITPNWHPIWVHFVIGLLIIGTLFYGLAWIGRKQSWSNTILAAARWNITLGIGFALIAFITGLLAAGSVPHDDAAHANMIVHRNWALMALLIFAVAGILLWSEWRKAVMRASSPVLALLLAGSAALAITGFEGGQNVFEHGLGVQRLPDVGHHDHAHAGHNHHGMETEDATHHEDIEEPAHDHDHDDAQHHDGDQPEPQVPEADSHDHEHSSSYGTHSH